MTAVSVAAYRFRCAWPLVVWLLTWHLVIIACLPAARGSLNLRVAHWYLHLELVLDGMQLTAADKSLEMPVIQEVPAL